MDENITRPVWFTLPVTENDNTLIENVRGNENVRKIENTENAKARVEIGKTQIENKQMAYSNASVTTGAEGSLPGGGSAPLATGWVPFQTSALPRYAPDEALTKGTLFPGLNLPFKNIANKGTPYAGTPLGEVLAISFAAHELVLYLDTHKNDSEAFGMLRELLELKKEAHRRYTELYGPLNTDDLINEQSYTWTASPFPWEYDRNEKGWQS